MVSRDSLPVTSIMSGTGLQPEAYISCLDEKMEHLNVLRYYLCLASSLSYYIR